jgi:hypothetical protein
VSDLEDREPSREGVGRELEMLVEVAVDELRRRSTTSVGFGITARGAGESGRGDVWRQVCHRIRQEAMREVDELRREGGEVTS